MIIAAFIIPKGYLPYIFGEDHEQITINLGGRNIYSFESNGSVIAKPNEFYLDDIFNNKIKLLSCVVGGNGGGKTTLLGLILNFYTCDYVIEFDDGNYKIISDLENFHRVYYTPYLNHKIFDSVGNNGKELSKIALLKMDNHGDSGLLDDFLEAHNSENSKRWIKLNNFLKKNQPVDSSMPVFHRVEITLKHFECNKINPDRFHDTSYQLRAPIRLLFKMIANESEVKEHEHFIAKGNKPDLNDLSHFKVRFEYAMYETILGKFVSILESAGNYYLNEGYIPEDFELHMNNLDVRSAIEWFLVNSGVFRRKSRYSFSQHLVLLKLMDYIRLLIIPANLTDNWLKIIVTEEQSLKIIELYDAFSTSFINDWFKYDTKPMFGFLPLINVSSGEQQFLNLFSVLYFHAENIKAGVDIDLHSFDSLKLVKKNILLLLDEADNAFHPQWKKEYVKNLRSILPIIFNGFNIQVIITTHDPLTLSDIPKNNVVFLEKGINGTTVGNSSIKHTFGANISDLLKDSFFLNDGQIGSFVSEKIDEIIMEIQSGQIKSESRYKFERIIRAIDEPIIKFKLAEMLSESIGDNQFEKELLDYEIQRLQEKRKSI